MSKSDKQRRLEWKLASATGDVRHFNNQLSRLTPGTQKYLDKLDELTKARKLMLEASRKLKECKDGDASG